ncbi:MAG: DUF1080 domain-containing protein [Rhodothermales bacterium]
MKSWIAIATCALLIAGCQPDTTPDTAGAEPMAMSHADTPVGEWISIFDGETLNGWTASEEPGTFRVENGELIVKGPRSHLYYTGPVGGHTFKNFEWKAEVMTKPGANSGMYIHTEFQEDGWPAKGYEVQVNNSHTDWRRTGGLYAIDDVREAPANDNEWFTEHIIVNGKRIITKVNDKTLVDYTEPENAERPDDMRGRRLSSGTVAIQGHDPESEVHYRNIMIKILPD